MECHELRHVRVHERVPRQAARVPERRRGAPIPARETLAARPEARRAVHDLEEPADENGGECDSDEQAMPGSEGQGDGETDAPHAGGA
jgi:hypothetical protein